MSSTEEVHMNPDYAESEFPHWHERKLLKYVPEVARPHFEGWIVLFDQNKHCPVRVIRPTFSDSFLGPMRREYWKRHDAERAEWLKTEQGQLYFACEGRYAI